MNGNTKTNGRVHGARRTSVGLCMAVVGVLALANTGCTSESRPAEWPYISAVIMEPDCATSSCHSRAAAIAGLDFSDADRGYTSLTGLWVWVPHPSDSDLSNLPCGQSNGETVCEERFRPLVVPYNPQESRLVNMLRARGAPRMPPDRPLDEPDIRLIEQWILNGALRTSDPTSGAPGATADASSSSTTDTSATAGGDGGARD